jgi:hypothetical protein
MKKVPAAELSARSRFSQRTFAGAHGNGRDATVAVLACPPSQPEIEQSNQTRALNPHSPTAPPTQTHPAVSSLEAFRTPASVYALAPVTGRRPKTLNDTRRSRDRDGTAGVDP